MLYFGAVLAGIGGGAIYATAVGQAVKWFPDRRGLAVGLTAAGFGAGAALTVIPIREVIASSGYQTAFFWFGLVQGVIVFLLAWFLRAPEADEIKAMAAMARRKWCSRRRATARRSAVVAGVLGPLHHVRPGLGQGPDGDGADRAHRQGLQRRQRGNPRRRHGAVGRADDRQSRQWRRASAVRLDFRHIGRENTMAIAFGLGAAPIGCSDRWARRHGPSCCSPH